MSPDEIQHFLIAFDPSSGRSDVRSFGTDYDAAQAAYAEAERSNGLSGSLDIVLLSADSLATIKKTHSSYFESASTLEELLSR
jgi:hypothetical protein